MHPMTNRNKFHIYSMIFIESALGDGDQFLVLERFSTVNVYLSSETIQNIDLMLASKCCNYQ